MSSQFGDRLRELRVEAGLGLREAARKADIDPSLWSKYETGKRRPPNPTTRPEEAETQLRKIADVFKNGQDDPYPELLALATLPDHVPTETIRSLSRHYKRHFKRRRG